MNLLLAVTGATGCAAARILLSMSPWPVWLVASRHGRMVYEEECGPFDELASRAARVFDDADLAAPAASGTVATAGMIILPCTTNTLAKVSSGVADSLITRAAHCHLKERRRLVLCVRETPWSSIDFENAARVSSAGGTVMPLSVPYYFFRKRDPREVSMHETLELFCERALHQFGVEPKKSWADS